ncbi:hypothetical protein [Halalkalibacter akibai]|uniref:hypothetical protein n=1 Tax=Halalkalibacter akibai TaxID=1411 RepID=UPI000AD1887B|nr:hypothetical protein [Halalkalibacter akibai]
MVSMYVGKGYQIRFGLLVLCAMFWFVGLYSQVANKSDLLPIARRLLIEFCLLLHF